MRICFYFPCATATATSGCLSTVCPFPSSKLPASNSTTTSKQPASLPFPHHASCVDVASRPSNLSFFHSHIMHHVWTLPPVPESCVDVAPRPRNLPLFRFPTTCIMCGLYPPSQQPASLPFPHHASCVDVAPRPRNLPLFPFPTTCIMCGRCLPSQQPASLSFPQHASCVGVAPILFSATPHSNSLSSCATLISIILPNNSRSLHIRTTKKPSRRVAAFTQ